tara:strand:- start:679 stop:798 length:120 start_codon:yes stop_codon:yes gene_type:complete
MSSLALLIVLGAVFLAVILLADGWLFLPLPRRVKKKEHR